MKALERMPPTRHSNLVSLNDAALLQQRKTLNSSRSFLFDLFYSWFWGQWNLYLTTLLVFSYFHPDTKDLRYTPCLSDTASRGE